MEKKTIGVAVLVLIAMAAVAGVAWKIGSDSARPVVTPAPFTEPTQAPPEQPTAPPQTPNNDSYFSIPEAGIKFKIPDSLKGELIYTIGKENSNYLGEKEISFGLSTKSLVQKGSSGCAINGLGSLIKVYADYTKDAQYSDSSKDVPWWHTKKGLEGVGAVQFKEFFIWFNGPQAVCLDKATPEMSNMLTKQSEELAWAVKSVELVK